MERLGKVNQSIPLFGTREDGKGRGRGRFTFHLGSHYLIHPIMYGRWEGQKERDML